MVDSFFYTIFVEQLKTTIMKQIAKQIEKQIKKNEKEIAVLTFVAKWIPVICLIIVVTLEVIIN